MRDTARVAAEQIKGLSTQVGPWAEAGGGCRSEGPVEVRAERDTAVASASAWAEARGGLL